MSVFSIAAQADVLFGMRTRFGVLMSSDGTVRAKSSLILQQVRVCCRLFFFAILCCKD
jgi:hypothetical protein